MIYTIEITYVADIYSLHNTTFENDNVQRPIKWKTYSYGMCSLFEQSKINAAEAWLTLYIEFISRYDNIRHYGKKELYNLVNNKEGPHTIEILNYFDIYGKHIFIHDTYPGIQLVYIKIKKEEHKADDGTIFHEPIELHASIQDIKMFNRISWYCYRSTFLD